MSAAKSGEKRSSPVGRGLTRKLEFCHFMRDDGVTADQSSERDNAFQNLMHRICPDRIVLLVLLGLYFAASRSLRWSKRVEDAGK
jgi:hypothetical protein